METLKEVLERFVGFKVIVYLPDHFEVKGTSYELYRFLSEESLCKKVKRVVLHNNCKLVLIQLMSNAYKYREG